MSSPRVLRVSRDPHDLRARPLQAPGNDRMLSTPTRVPGALPTLTITHLRHDGRTWRAVPPLTLAVQRGWTGYWTAHKALGLYARADTIAHLEPALARSLAILWDAVVIEDYHRLSETDRELLWVLTARFTVDGTRIGRRVELPGYDPACKPGCLGGNGCGHRRIS